MDVIIIFNGLGNQMSQYAFYLQKRQKSSSTKFLFSHKSRKMHNGFELTRVFGIHYKEGLLQKLLYLLFLALEYKKFPFLSKPIINCLHLLGCSIIRENDDYNFKPEYLQSKKGIHFYVGGWHAEKYFIDVKEDVLKAFQFNPATIGAENDSILQKIKSTHSISVHIRRGDFLDSNNYHKFGSVCTLNYFIMAIEKMRSLVNNPHFYFFTNDPDWVKQHFSGPDYSLININKSENSWKDMFLISNCSHHINSNGSFSWWSSWLNRHKEKIVIVPKNFMANREFEDIYPIEWIRLSDY